MSQGMIVAGDGHNLNGQTVVLVPMVLNAHAGTSTDLVPVLAGRASACAAQPPGATARDRGRGWFGIQTWIGASPRRAVPGGLAGWSGVPAHNAIASVFWLIQVP